MLNIVLFGPPGAGKGTQSEKLISAYHLVHLSTGDILRAEIAAGTDSGMEAKKLMDAGFLVPDEVVINMIRTKLEQNQDAKGFIFDGFPRTTAQAEALDRLLKEKNTEITLMLALEVSDEELVKRLLLRGKASGRPDDVNEEIIQKRIEEYNKKTAPLKEYYSAQNKFESVKGVGTIDEIFESLCAAINFIQSESTAEVNQPVHEETVAEKITSFVKNVFSKKKEVEIPLVKKISSGKPAKKNPAKEETAASRKAPSTPAKRVEAYRIKKPAVKNVKKTLAKKTIPSKAISKNSGKKAAVKKVIAKKVAPKKIVLKKVAASSKTIKKAVAKKTAVKKIAAKKIAPKKIAAKKTIAKKTTGKTVKKVAPKKATKKVAAKKTSAKKVAKKVVSKKTAKKAVKKTAPKKSSAKKAVKQNKKVASKKTVKKRK
jgi:adenylate kinase